jgi:5-methylcytosine-specific restriction endonuclease McrA
MDYSQYPTNRAAAKATGAKYYFTGEPCKHGHIALRKTKGSCVECLKNEWQEGSKKRIDYFSSYNKSEAGKKSKQKYYEKNRDAVIARAQGRTDEEKRRYRKTHKINNPELYKEFVNARRRRFRTATPKWLTPEHKMEIRLKYRLAIELSKQTGIRYAVDHVIPLLGETVSGLHVPWNLEVITQDENLKKYNKLLDSSQNP